MAIAITEVGEPMNRQSVTIVVIGTGLLVLVALAAIVIAR